MSPQELDLVPMDDLLDALERRFDGHAFVAYQNTTDDARHIRRNWKGDMLLLQGLTAQVSNMIGAAHLATARDPAE